MVGDCRSNLTVVQEFLTGISKIVTNSTWLGLGPMPITVRGYRVSTLDIFVKFIEKKEKDANILTWLLLQQSIWTVSISHWVSYFEGFDKASRT